MKKSIIMTILGLIALLSLSMSGCRDDYYHHHHDDDDDYYSECSGEMQDRENISGDPDEINRYDSYDYHTRTYWYYCDGFAETFTWGENVRGCETHTNRFVPVCD